MMAHITENGWLAVGQSLDGVLRRARAWLATDPAEISVEEIMGRHNDHLLDDIGVRRSCAEGQASPSEQRHRFWML